MSSITASKKIIVWQYHWIFELSLAHELKIDLFPDCEVRNPSQFHLYSNNDINIVIYAFFFFEGSSDPKEDFSWADTVIHYCNEIIVGPWKDYKKRITASFNNSKTTTIASGHRNCYDHPEDEAYLDLLHFFNTLTDHCNIEESALPKHKEKQFDVLLGTAKIHRVLILEKLLEHKIEDYCLINMTRDIHDNSYNNSRYNYRSDSMDRYEDPAVITQTQVPGMGSMTAIKGMRNGHNLSQSIPDEIYKNCWYSVVAETNPEFSTFFTEKTAKCLMSKRLFVFFGSKGQLAKLHEHGYKTFGTVIDESYDNIEDPTERWTAGVRQMLKLMEKDPLVVYQELRSVLEHNQRLILDQTARLKKIKDFINHACLKKYINNAEK